MENPFFPVDQFNGQMLFERYTLKTVYHNHEKMSLIPDNYHGLKFLKFSLRFVHFQEIMPLFLCYEQKLFSLSTNWVIFHSISI